MSGTGKLHPEISIITPVKNAYSTIELLFNSLQRQTFKNFEWIVMDGESNDGTMDFLAKIADENPWVRAISKSDCGLYDAINKGIEISEAMYYVVAGADDEFYPTAMSDYLSAVTTHGKPDVVLARVCREGIIIGGFSPTRGWIGHSKAFKGSHSIGMLFRKELHAEVGMYSNRFKLLADGYFLKHLLKKKNIQIVDAEFIAGNFSTTGLSSIRKMQTLVETWQIQMLTEKHLFLQTCLFIGKVIARYPSIVRELRKKTPP